MANLNICSVGECERSSRVTMLYLLVSIFMLLSLIFNGNCQCIYRDREPKGLECTGVFNSKELDNLSKEIQHLNFHDAITLPPVKLQPKHFAQPFLLKSTRHISLIRMHNWTLISIEKNAFGGLEYLEELDLSDNRLLRNMHPEAISQATLLERLDLSGNAKLFNRIAGPILISDSLVELVLSRCEIEYLPHDAFDELKKLKTVFLDHNKLRKLPPSLFGGVEKLLWLDLQNNFLRGLPTGMLTNNTQINKLVLNGNPISDIPKDIFPDSLQADITLDLQETEMTTINIPPLEKLITLNLGGSPVSSIKRLSNFPNLNYLNLSYTKINEVDKDSFKNNTILETISLSGIPSLSLPIQFTGYFPYLYYMDISNCGLVHLMPDLFQSMKSIASLNLSRNALNDSESLGRALNPLAKLKILDLSHNKLRIIGDEEFSGNPNLLTIYLSGNQLLSPPSIPSIQTMDLSYCSLTSINLPEIFRASNQLQQLFLSNNNLSSITDDYHEEFSPWEIPGSLNVLDLSENPWSCDPSLLNLIEEAKNRSIQPCRVPPQLYEPSGDYFLVNTQLWDNLVHEACRQPHYDVVIPLRPLNLPSAIVGATTEKFPVWIWYITGIFVAFSIACGVAVDQFRRRNRHQGSVLLPPQQSINISLVGATGGMKLPGRSKDYQRLKEDRSPNSPTTPRIYRPPQNGKGNHFTFPNVQSSQDPESFEPLSDHEKE